MTLSFIVYYLGALSNIHIYCKCIDPIKYIASYSMRQKYNSSCCEIESAGTEIISLGGAVKLEVDLAASQQTPNKN